MGEIDQVPTGKFPMAFGARFMFEPNHKVDRVIEHFVRRCLGLEIKRAETTLPAPRRVELGIEIEDALRFLIENPQIRITGALDMTIGGAREIAAQSRPGI